MMDPLGRMMVTMDGFRGLANIMLEVAAETCGGRLVGLQEGGYSPAYVPFCTLAIVEAFLGRRSAVQDPYTDSSELVRSQHEYRPQQSAAVDAVIAMQRQFWRL